MMGPECLRRSIIPQSADGFRPDRGVRYAGAMNDASRRKPGKARAVDQIAHSGGGGLSGLLARARRLQRMDQALEAELDPRIAPHVRVANVRDGALVLATPVAPIAQRLKMEAPRLLAAMQRGFPGAFERLEVMVTPDLPARG